MNIFSAQETVAVFVSGVTTECSQDDFKVCLPGTLYLYLEAYTSHQRQTISDRQETSGSLGRLCRKERLVEMASDRETGALFGKASGC